MTTHTIYPPRTPDALLRPASIAALRAALAPDPRQAETGTPVALRRSFLYHPEEGHLDALHADVFFTQGPTGPIPTPYLGIPLSHRAAVAEAALTLEWDTRAHTALADIAHALAASRHPDGRASGHTRQIHLFLLHTGGVLCLPRRIILAPCWDIVPLLPVADTAHAQMNARQAAPAITAFAETVPLLLG